MVAQHLTGRELAAHILQEVTHTIQTKELKLKLGIIQVGDDEASTMYIRNKIKRAEQVGIKADLYKFKNDVSEEDIIEQINLLNADINVTGFFIQAPLPEHLNLQYLAAKIAPNKDVDGLTPENLGKLFQGRCDCLVSATAVACYALLKNIPDYQLAGKHAVIIGRSTILGKPLAALLLNKDCTVTICHSKTEHLSDVCKTADILVSATGKEKLVTKDFVKNGAVVIDCGAPKAEVDFEHVQYLTTYISPVPGGVGPLTIASLLKNCVKASGIQQ